IFRIGAETSENAEDRLNEEGRLHRSLVDEIRKIVEVGGVVALELETRLAGRAQVEHALDRGEAVGEDVVDGVGDVGPLPVVLEVLEAVQHGEGGEVDR